MNNSLYVISNEKTLQRQAIIQKTFKDIKKQGYQEALDDIKNLVNQNIIINLQINPKHNEALANVIDQIEMLERKNKK